MIIDDEKRREEGKDKEKEKVASSLIKLFCCQCNSGTVSVLSGPPKQLWRWRWQCLFCNLQFRLCVIAPEQQLAHKNQNHWDWASLQEILFDPGSQSPCTKLTQTHIFISFLHCFQWGCNKISFRCTFHQLWVAFHEFYLVLQRPLHCFQK